MKKERGAALIVVLSLLSVMLMVGLSSMQSSIVSERLAGNYRAAVQADMAAESVAAEFLDPAERNTSRVQNVLKNIAEEGGSQLSIDDEIFSDARESLIEGLFPSDFEDMDKDERGRVRKRLESRVSNSLDVSGDRGVDGEVQVTFCDQGLRRNAKSCVALLYERSESGDTPFHDGLIGCNGVLVDGGGSIGSSVRTLSGNSDVRMVGGTHVEGDVFSTGGFSSTGGASVGGDIRANGDVVIGASAEYGGSVFSAGSVSLDNTAVFSGGVYADGDVQFNNGARVGGDLSAGGDVIFSHTGGYVEGEVTAAGEIHNDFESWKGTESFAGGDVKNGSHDSVEPAPSSECDILSLPSVFEGFAMPSNGDVTVGRWPRVNATVTPRDITSFDQTWNVQEDVVLAESSDAAVMGFESERPVIRTGDLTLTNGEMRITGGDVILYVDGDLTLGSGGGPGLTIDAGSTLTIFVTGTTNVKSSTQMSDVPQMTNGRPTFSLFVSKEDASSRQSSVTINGSAQATANIYAPFANVVVTAGGGLKGSVRAKTIEVSGGAGVFHDQDVGDWSPGAGDGEEFKLIGWQ